MTVQPKRTPWKFIGAAIALFAIGFGIGFYLQHRRSEEVRDGMKALGEHMLVYHYADVQYNEAAYEEAKAALERQMRYLDSTRSQPDFLRDTGTDAFEKSFLHGRLALLEERENRIQAAEFQWARAEEHFRRTKSKDPSREYLRRIIERLDAGSWPQPLNEFPKMPR